MNLPGSRRADPPEAPGPARPAPPAPPPPDLHRVGRLVAGVIGEAVRERGAAGVMIASAATPERKLVAGWLGEIAEVRTPDPDRVAAVAEALAGPDGAVGEEDGAVAAAAVGGLEATAADLLVVGAANRTVLLTTGALRTAPLEALGDVYAGWILAWTGSCTRPHLRRRGPPLSDEQLHRLDAALHLWLEGRGALTDALAALGPELRTSFGGTLRRGTAYGRVALVPKLGRWTPGVDPSP